MEKTIGFLLSIMPLVFGFGFLAPVMSQGIEHIGWAPPLALSPLAFALIVCGGWGIVAQLRGRWL